MTSMDGICKQNSFWISNNLGFNPLDLIRLKKFALPTILMLSNTWVQILNLRVPLKMDRIYQDSSAT